MRRRLTLTMVLLTAGTLLVTGVVTLLLTVHTAREQTRREIAGEATSLAKGVRSEAAGPVAGNDAVRLRRVLAILKKPLHLDGSAVVTLTRAGTLAPVTATGVAQPLPDGLRASDIDVAGLAVGGTVSGLDGNLAFAAAPLLVTYHVGAADPLNREVIVLVRRAPSGLATALPWLLVSSAAVLVVAFLVADRLVRRTVRPLRTAEAVTARIAGGDLTARVGEEPGTDPELRRLGGSINAMAEALAAAQGSQRQFLLSVSHELRTPLTSIQGWAEALEDGTATDVARAAGIIAGESHRLDRLVSDLLELARLDTGRFSLQPAPVHLPTVVSDTVAAFGPAAAELGLTLDHSGVDHSGVDHSGVDHSGVDHSGVDGGALDVWADPDRLSQVVSNLVENALNYASGAVVVGASTTPAGAVVWVDDDGPGVRPDDLPRIFTRLFSSTERPGRKVGTGLGLAIVAELVASMGGHVRAESPLGSGRGTRVVVTLRLAPTPDGPGGGPPR